MRTTLAGWKRHKNHPDARIRRRYAWEARELATTFSAAVAGAKLYYRNEPEMQAKISAVLDDLHREFGWKSRLFSALGSRYVLWRLRREEKLLASGWSYEPPTFYEKNDACEDEQPARCRTATPSAAPVKPIRAVRAPAARPTRMKRRSDEMRHLRLGAAEMFSAPGICTKGPFRRQMDQSRARKSRGRRPPKRRREALTRTRTAT